MLALKMLASTIADKQTVVPIIEPVNGNDTTKGAIEKYIEEGMPFLFIANPKHGDYKGNGAGLYNDLYADMFAEYDNYIPTLHINRGTRIQEVNSFNERYDTPFRAVIYNAEPAVANVRDWCASDDRIYHHIFLDGKVSSAFTQSVTPTRRVLIRDNFNRQVRNSDYPAEVEHFSDMNTPAGNTENVNWGDYSIIGDQYSDGGG
ncbi:MAG: sce7725 family protein, partial [Verrucomicrobiota bacterium]